MDDSRPKRVGPTPKGGDPPPPKGGDCCICLEPLSENLHSCVQRLHECKFSDKGSKQIQQSPPLGGGGSPPLGVGPTRFGRESSIIRLSCHNIYFGFKIDHPKPNSQCQNGET